MPSKTPLLVKDRMTRDPHTISSADTIGKAAELFDRYEIRHLPVCDGGRVVGMITHRDLRRAHPVSAIRDPGQHEAYLKETKVKQIMASPALTVTPSTPMKDAVQILIETKFGGLPVVEEGKLVGILSPIDALKALLDLL
jgi:acetoin utilization protein AcuB